MTRLQHLAIAEIHVHTARQARIEAAYRPHDVNTFELIRPVLLEDRRVLHRILVRPRRAIHIAWIGIPWGRRIGMVVCDFALADYDVMREYSTDCFMESAANRFFGHFEVRPRLRPSTVEFFQRLLHEVKSA